MKKFNFTLIIIVSILTVIKVLGNLDTELVYILKDLSVIVTLSLTYIIQKVFKIKLSDGLSLIYIIFIIMAHYLGVIEGFYNKYALYDKVTHTLSGVLSAYAAYILLKAKKSNDTLLNVLFIISFTFLCAGMWEIFEFTCDNLLHGNAQRVIETGVSDTMWDIIVAFMGSVIFTIIIFVKGKFLK